jgi:hypothetical protein
MGRTYRFNKKDGWGGRKRKKTSKRRAKKQLDLGKNRDSEDYDIGEQLFERFSRHGKPRKS